MHPDSDRLLHGAPGVANPLEAAVLNCVASPAGHPADVELPIHWAEAAAVRTRLEVARQRHDGPLKLAGHLVAEDETLCAQSVREVEQMTAERAPAVTRHIGLAAARVIEPTGDHDHRQARRRASEVREGLGGRLACPLPDDADRRGGRVIALRDGHRDRAIGQEAQPIGIAKSHSEYIDL